MKIFERKPEVHSASECWEQPLSQEAEPRQALPATLRCPRAPKGFNRLSADTAATGLAPRGQGSKNQKESLRGSPGKSQGPRVLE